MGASRRFAAILLVGFVCACGNGPAQVTEVFPNPEENAEKNPKFWRDLNRRTLEKRLREERRDGIAQNVILFIGDGMGLSTLTAARIFKGQLAGVSGEEGALSFDQFPYTSLSKVYSVDRMVPDSGSSGTALQCGVKSNFFTTGVSGQVNPGNCTQSSDPKNHLKCLYQWAQDADKSTGFVTTAEVTDATPAAGYAHTAHREWESRIPEGAPGGCLDIAHQLIHRSPGRELKFIAGGGRGHFQEVEVDDGTGSKGLRRDNRNLISEWVDLKRGDRIEASYAFDWKSLKKIDMDVTESILALLAPSELPYESLDDIKKGESYLAKLTALAISSLSKNPDGYLLMVEGGQIDKAHHLNQAQQALIEVLGLDLAVAKAVEMTNPDDTLIVVTADHGHAFTFGGRPQRGRNILGTERPDKSVSILNYAVGPGYKSDYSNLSLSTRLKDPLHAFPATYRRDMGTHSGEDVPVFALGPCAHLFTGVHEQTLIAEVIRYAANLDETMRGSKRGSILSILSLSIPRPLAYAFALIVVYYIHGIIRTLL
ncbi:alkaline phosphatase-like isoform X1 [Ornithodoros turicata]|uniref:alkaline phosphatase-like isoform X1 n=1 Tax=Ornithodoros turicata TaxID=34597 RepID=UPI00313A227A